MQLSGQNSRVKKEVFEFIAWPAIGTWYIYTLHYLYKAKIIHYLSHQYLGHFIAFAIAVSTNKMRWIA